MADRIDIDDIAKRPFVIRNMWAVVELKPSERNALVDVVRAAFGVNIDLDHKWSCPSDNVDRCTCGVAELEATLAPFQEDT